MYDILIKNAVIYDGTGADAFTGSVAVKDGRIAAVGDAGGTAAHVIDAAGRALTPGFIDPHSHADLSALMYPGMEAYLLQGVTTVVGGNCGHGMAPMGGELYRSAVIDFPLTQAVKPSYFQLVSLLLPRAGAEKAAKELFGIDMHWHSLGEYIDECNSRGLGANIAPLAGYSAIRNAVMGSDCMREATPEELDRLEALVEDCMRQGAFGLSTGLDPQYIPGLFATDSETVRMLRVVRRYGGVFASHTFNVGPDGTGGRMEGYEKMLSQALAAGVRANVSHVHLLGMASTGDGALAAARATLAYFSEMRAKGLDLSYDVIPTPVAIDFTIPYFAFFIRPFVLMAGSRQRLAEAFRVEDFRAAVHAIIGAGLYPALDAKIPGNYFGLLSVTRHRDASLIGKTFTQLASERGAEPLDVMMDIFAADPDMEAGMGSADFTEANDLLCAQDMAMPCSDGFSCAADTNFTADAEVPVYPNPMNVGYAARFLTRYAGRFEDAVRKASGLVAERFNISGRGLIRPGFHADLVLLDRSRLRSYDETDTPLRSPDGIDLVLVGGAVAAENGRVTGSRTGRMLRRGEG